MHTDARQVERSSGYNSDGIKIETISYLNVSGLKLDRFVAAGLSILLFCICIQLAFVIYACEGNFSYSLDDPYIHLALAENLLRAHYGINLEDASAPSSSIIYPVLLAGTLKLGLGQYGPLVINVVSALATFCVLLRTVHGDQRLIPSGHGPSALGLVLALSLATNLIGIVFTGMEHSLQILFTLLSFLGLIQTIETNRVPPWFTIVLVINPLIRFEGIALSGLTLLALAYLGHWKATFSAALTVTATVGIFLGWLSQMGLSPMPSSVLAKSPLMLSAFNPSPLIAVGKELLNNIYNATNKSAAGLFLFLFAALLLFKPMSRWPIDKRDHTHIVALVSTLAILAQLVVGRFGGFARYELYALYLSYAAIVYVWQEPLRRFFLSKNRIAIISLLTFFLAITAKYWTATVLTPIASASIYNQQYQMHRFVKDYLKQPVAVNELGWVSYNNDYYVLDLWGLGSEQALRLRKSLAANGPHWMESLALLKGVHVVMIYDNWFGAKLPQSWTHLGTLRTDLPFTTADQPYVEFYSTQLANTSAVVRALESFKKTLPKHTVYVPDSEISKRN